MKVFNLVPVCITFYLVFKGYYYYNAFSWSDKIVKHRHQIIVYLVPIC